jgi:type IV pilus assembly protein PilB
VEKETLIDIFVKAGLLDGEEKKFVLEANRKNPEEEIADTLIRLKFGTEEDVAKAFASHYKCPYIDLATGLDPQIVRRIPLTLASQKMLIAVREEDGHLLVAMTKPNDMETAELVRFATDMPVKMALATASAIEKAIQEQYRVEENIAGYMQNVPDQKKGIELMGEEQMNDTDIRELKKRSEAAPVIQLVNSILFQGITKGASDIHVEPREKEVHVRNRVDGILHEALQAPKWVQAAMTSRLKLMAGMDIAEKRVPQDGRIKIKVDGKAIDLRVSTLPTQFGEKVVIRVLDSNKSAPTLGDIGFHPEIISPVKTILHQPQGMLLVCGPTGSGKTTTLYGLLSEIAKKKINIVTLEDPIEYVLPGLNQVQVNEKAGLTFSKSLRSVLRQDPNVVFLGEVRDQETAEIALRASITGHLVLSTLHTNDSIATVARLLDLKIEPYLVASALSGVLAQRLVRTICTDCREEHEPNVEVVKKVESVLGEEISFVFYHGKGCDKCGGTGYRGRMGIHEFLPVTPEVREIIRSQGASEAKIRTAARKAGFRSLLEDALEKMKMGLTTVEEVERVVVFHAAEKEEAPASLPSHPPSTAEPAPTAAITPPSAALKTRRAEDFTGYKVLVADDEEDIQKSVAMYLLKNKFTVSVAANGREALEVASKEKPHLIVSDVLMPDMDGLELVRRIRQDVTTTFTPVILLSQKSEVADRLKGFAVGTDDYVPKPFDPEELLQRIKAVLRRAYA